MGRFADLNDSALRSRREDSEDMDPMSSVANLADCMLVLACGLMVALVIAWNIDISNITEVTPLDDAEEISDLEMTEDAPKAGGTSFIDLGSVYQDPETGKMYMVEKQDGDDGEATEGGGE